MAKRLPIKPGCLCLVLSGADRIPDVVGPGSVVTAVRYIGTSRDIAGQVLNDVWEITSPTIVANFRVHPLCFVGCSASYLQPISDPDQDITILLEQVDELAAEQRRQQTKLLRHAINYNAGPNTLSRRFSGPR